MLVDAVEDVLDDLRIFQESEFKLRSPLQKLMHLRGVTHAGKFDDYAPCAFFLDGRLGKAKLVDTVADDLDRAIDGFVGALLQRGLNRGVIAIAGLGKVKTIRKGFAFGLCDLVEVLNEHWDDGGLARRFVFRGRVHNLLK